MDATALDSPRRDFGSEACFRVFRWVGSLGRAFANVRRDV